MKNTHQSRPRRSRQGGAALIEALIGILIFAFGIIGLVGLQVAMARAQGAAKVRADAANLASAVIGTMWADRPNLEEYNTAKCKDHDPCKDWTSKVAASLPAATTQLTVTPATGLVDLTITWSTPAEGTHTYVLSTSIR